MGQLGQNPWWCLGTTTHKKIRTLYDGKEKAKTTGAIPDAFTSVDECARALEDALAAMDPPIDVYEGILKFIGELAQPYGKSHGLFAQLAVPRRREQTLSVA